jgi:hypothetical protein
LKFRLVTIALFMWPVMSFGMEGERKRADSSSLVDGTLGRRGTAVDDEEDVVVGLTPEAVTAALAQTSWDHLDNLFIWGRNTDGEQLSDGLSIASRASGITVSASYMHTQRPRSARGRRKHSGGFDSRGRWQRHQVLPSSSEEAGERTTGIKKHAARVPDEDEYGVDDLNSLGSGDEGSGHSSNEFEE